MTRRAIGIVLGFHVFAYAYADAPSCPDKNPARITAGKAPDAPASFDRLVRLEMFDKGKWGALVGDAAGGTFPQSKAEAWKPETVERLRKQFDDSQFLSLVWADAGGSECRQVLLAGPREAGTVVVGDTGSQEVDELTSCRTLATEAESRIPGGGRGQHTFLAFLESGELCYQNRTYGIEGDPIFVAVLTYASTDWRPLRFDPCSVEPDAPALFVSTQGPVRASAPQAGEPGVLHTYTPRACFNRSVSITLSGTKGDKPLQITYALGQAARYRGTLQLGALFSPQQQESFTLRQTNDGSVIRSTGPTGKGVEYTAAIVLYGLPNYFTSLLGRKAYQGRDIVHEQGILDRLGGVLGVGLSDPTKRFIAGFSFEALYGVNVVGVWEIARLRKLDGVKEGDLFSGTADAIPTKERWSTRWVWGVSIDLVYVKELFSGRLAP